MHAYGCSPTTDKKDMEMELRAFSGPSAVPNAAQTDKSTRTKAGQLRWRWPHIPSLLGHDANGSKCALRFALYKRSPAVNAIWSTMAGR